jgi:pimeloyl-ACP methyl ester carboxylesterase
MLRKYGILALLFLVWAQIASAQEDPVIKLDGYIRVPAASVVPVRQSCNNDPCPDHDAIVFVHGIFSDDTSFRNGSFDWPSQLPTEIGGHKIDVFRISYTTQFFSWLKSSSIDEVTYSIFRAVYPEPNSGDPGSALHPDRYRSVNFIAHSLGGNIALAFLHTVKSELGHAERARYGFVVTLGTPINGAQIANVGEIAKRLLGMPADPLLASLERDNTFLRMLALWHRSEDVKARKFRCRLIDLYAGIEGADMHGIRVVPEASAESAFKGYAKETRAIAFDSAALA